MKVNDTNTVPTDINDGYFVLGYWLNAYSRASDKEYFWSGPFFERKNALAKGKMIQERGQPHTFCDWSKGVNKIVRGTDKFVAAAKKVGLNPNIADLEWRDNY